MLSLWFLCDNVLQKLTLIVSLSQNEITYYRGRGNSILHLLGSPRLWCDQWWSWRFLSHLRRQRLPSLVDGWLWWGPCHRRRLVVSDSIVAMVVHLPRSLCLCLPLIKCLTNIVLCHIFSVEIVNRQSGWKYRMVGADVEVLADDMSTVASKNVADEQGEFSRVFTAIWLWCMCMVTLACNLLLFGELSQIRWQVQGYWQGNPHSFDFEAKYICCLLSSSSHTFSHMKLSVSYYL